MIAEAMPEGLAPPKELKAAHLDMDAARMGAREGRHMNLSRPLENQTTPQAEQRA